ncbi:hypothetical protein M405DRAFT_832910 [Rhizopogon salebrosus TDB-379]|nr:hypothetical protein M405DRAFT_832910 [Rhizopogon salebrosus TDB-379]
MTSLGLSAGVKPATARTLNPSLLQPQRAPRTDANINANPNGSIFATFSLSVTQYQFKRALPRNETGQFLEDGALWGSVRPPP